MGITAGRSARSVLAAGAVAVLAGVGLVGCNPAPGHARVEVSGHISGSAQGPKVTCSSGSGVSVATWTGTIAGKPTTLEVYRGVEGDLDGIRLLRYGRTYQALDHDLVTVDPYGVLHLDQELATGSPIKRVQVAAALRCP